MSTTNEVDDTAAAPWVGDEETSRVVQWRFSQLLRGGYSHGDAVVIAAQVQIDLHVALDVVQRGCPPELASRILL